MTSNLTIFTLSLIILLVKSISQHIMAQLSSPLATRIFPRRKPSSASEEATIAPVESFPTANHLIVTTPKGVHTWTHEGVDEIFRSGSGGIVAAKKTGDGSDLLAVADSQIVLLHDIKKGRPQSYRLKGINVSTSLHHMKTSI